jgi:hypothetical protein
VEYRSLPCTENERQDQQLDRAADDRRRISWKVDHHARSRRGGIVSPGPGPLSSPPIHNMQGFRMIVDLRFSRFLSLARTSDPREERSRTPDFLDKTILLSTIHAIT